MGKDFLLHKNEMLLYLTIPQFEDTKLVKHGFSTRLGGVSQRPFHTLNLGLHVEDKKEDVLQNRQRFSKVLDIPWLDMVAAEQVHGEDIYLVTEKDKGKGAGDYATALSATDALITNIPGIPLSTYFADCVPLFFLDPDNCAIGLAHAGWKGTLSRIGAKTLLRMGEEFGTSPARCLIGIGPSIGPCCYEVDEHVTKKFEEGSWEMAKIFQPFNQKWKLDLQTANQLALLEVGALQENIFRSDFCTSCRTDLFFSFRAEEGQTGRMSALLMLAGK